MGDHDFERELRKIKEELNNKKKTEPEIPDMDKILVEKKKKLVIKMKNYKFTSVNDVFEGRDEKDKEEII